MVHDVRLCFIGDSFVAGAGDPEHRGWVGRLLTDPIPGVVLTGYNLGVRGNTSSEVLARWGQEVLPRLRTAPLGGLVISFGVNDTAPPHRSTHPTPRSLTHLDQLLIQAGAAGYPTLVVGPPPVADPEHNRRTVALDRAYAGLCAHRGTCYVPVIGDLLHDEVWAREVTQGDGAHPSAAGYTRLADLVRPTWHHWLSRLVQQSNEPHEEPATTKIPGVEGASPTSPDPHQP